MSRITDPKWREPPKTAHVMVLQIGDYNARAAFWEWCYANCKGKVIGCMGTLNQPEIVLEQSPRNDIRGHKYHSFSYGDGALLVLVEDDEDAMLIKLAWGGV